MYSVPGTACTVRMMLGAEPLGRTAALHDPPTQLLLPHPTESNARTQAANTTRRIR